MKRMQIAMDDTGCCQVLKRLAVDVLMVLVFVLLIGIAFWIFWVYFIRGPVDIETRGFVSRTVQNEAMRPSQAERYTLRHFHSLDEVVLGGIKSESLCVRCHGDYPHSKEKKVRTFYNAHSWFMACEVCHLKPEEKGDVVFRWLAHNTGAELTQLQGEAGDYGAMIVPVRLDDGDVKRLDESDDKEYIEEFIRLEENLADYQKELAQERIHKPLSKKTVSCGECHTTDGLLDFKGLLYSSKVTAHLESLDMGAMTSTYEQFHLPAILNPKQKTH